VEVLPVGKGKFVLDKYSVLRTVTEVGIIEIQIKDDGAINDTPSFCAIMKDIETNVYYTQFSYETLQAILSKMGYRCVKKKET
jgi:hypothetical protein